MNARQAFGWYLIIGGVLFLVLFGFGGASSLSIACPPGTNCTGPPPPSGSNSVLSTILLVLTFPASILASVLNFLPGVTGNFVAAIASVLGGYLLLHRRKR